MISVEEIEEITKLVINEGIRQSVIKGFTPEGTLAVRETGLGFELVVRGLEAPVIVESYTFRSFNDALASLQRAYKRANIGVL